MSIQTIPTTGPMTLVVGWRVGQGVETGRVSLTQGIGNQLRAACNEAVMEIADRDQKPYSADASLEAEEVMVVPRNSLEANHFLFGLVAHPTGANRVSAHNLPQKPMLFYACSIGHNAADRVGFVRNTNPHLTVKAGRFLGSLGDSLSRIDDTVFAFDDRMDLVVTPTSVVVLNLPSFERLFRDEPTLLAAIPDWVAEIAAHLPMADEAIAELDERSASDGRLRRRLLAIHERGHLATVTLADIRREATRQGIKQASIIRNGQLVIDQIDAGTLLRLLNEDLMTGGLSGTRFSVERKAPR